MLPVQSCKSERRTEARMKPLRLWAGGPASELARGMMWCTLTAIANMLLLRWSRWTDPCDQNIPAICNLILQSLMTFMSEKYMQLTLHLLDTFAQHIENSTTRLQQQASVSVPCWRLECGIEPKESTHLVAILAWGCHNHFPLSQSRRPG